MWPSPLPRLHSSLTRHASAVLAEKIRLLLAGRWILESLALRHLRYGDGTRESPALQHRSQQRRFDGLFCRADSCTWGGVIFVWQLADSNIRAPPAPRLAALLRHRSQAADTAYHQGFLGGSGRLWPNCRANRIKPCSAPWTVTKSAHW